MLGLLVVCCWQSAWHLVAGGLITFYLLLFEHEHALHAAFLKLHVFGRRS